MQSRKVSLRSSTWTAILSPIWTIFVLGLAAAAGYSAANTAAIAFLSWQDDPIYVGFALYLFEAFACIVVHELGHVIAAKTVGWQVRSIAVGPFAYLPTERRVVVVDRRVSQWLSGLVTAVPPSSDRREIRSRAVFVLGGPLANILFGLTIFPFESALKAPWNPGNSIAVIFGSLSIVSLTVGIANLVPFYLHDLKSDGLRLLNMFVHSRARNRTSAQFDTKRRYR